MAKLLIVDDDISLCDKMREFLMWEQHVVDLAHTGGDAVQMLTTYKYDVIVLDWNLPEIAGVEICKQFRSTGGITPILMLTGKDAVEEKEQALDAGADDYVTKPFHARELAARVRALARRKGEIIPSTLSVGELLLEVSAHRVTRNGRNISLQPKEFVLLSHLMKNPNQPFTAKALLETLWSADKEASEETIRTYMKTLRRKISSDGEECPIKTIHGLGYKIEG